MPTIEITRKETAQVKYLKVEAEVRYWEDADVNGEGDKDGTLIPCRVGDCFSPIIDLETCKIEGWPEGTTADLHYKVCDAGRYALLDGDRAEVKVIDGYVPGIMCPGGNGYGDYIIMHIGANGEIADFDANDLDSFQDDD